MTPALQRELHALAVQLAHNGISELAESSGFSWPFIDSNIKQRAAEILRGEGSV